MKLKKKSDKTLNKPEIYYVAASKFQNVLDVKRAFYPEICNDDEINYKVMINYDSLNNNLDLDQQPKPNKYSPSVIRHVSEICVEIPRGKYYY